MFGRGNEAQEMGNAVQARAALARSFSDHFMSRLNIPLERAAENSFLRQDRRLLGHSSKHRSR
jgi:hypothetical protein